MHVFQFFVVPLQRDSEEHPLVRLFDMVIQILRVGTYLSY
jgi:hypothetical protein